MKIKIPQQRKYTIEVDRKLKILQILSQQQKYTIGVDQKLKILFSEFLVILTRSFSSLWQFFRQVHKVKIRRCQFSVQFKFFSQIQSVILVVVVVFIHLRNLKQ